GRRAGDRTAGRRGIRGEGDLSLSCRRGRLLFGDGSPERTGRRKPRVSPGDVRGSGGRRGSRGGDTRAPLQRRGTGLRRSPARRRQRVGSGRKPLTGLGAAAMIRLPL